MTAASVMTYDSLVENIQSYLERTDTATLEKIPLFIMLAEQVIAAEIKFLGNLTVNTSTTIATYPFFILFAYCLLFNTMGARVQLKGVASLEIFLKSCSASMFAKLSFLLLRTQIAFSAFRFPSLSTNFGFNTPS